MLDIKGFDLWAEGYDKSVGLSDDNNTYPFASYKKILNEIYKRILTSSAKKVLDIGFGTGILTTRLYEEGCEIYGQDFSEEMIKIAKEKMPNANLYSGDFTNGLVKPLEKQAYDAIIATYSLHHLDNDQKVQFIKSLLGLLSQGGIIYIGDVAFQKRDDLESCRLDALEYWDDEEIYFVYEELKERLPNLKFEKYSFCSGLLTIANLKEPTISKLKRREYLENPTGASALSFWKTCNFKTPTHIKVLNENDFNPSLLETYNDEVYFKLVHYLDDIDKPFIADEFIFVKASTEDLANHINSCYEEEGLTVSELESYKKKPVYDEDLWICLYDKKNDAIAATGIAEFDDEIKEGYLDWIQVSEKYRGQGLAKAIVYELLRRLKENASFVTVAGRVDNKTKPEKLYESCGFKDKVLWHILMEKN